MPEPEAFSISEASEVAGLGRSSINAAIRAGQLCARKFGRRTIILPADLRQFLATLPPVKPMDEKAGADAMSTREYEHKLLYPNRKNHRAEKKNTAQGEVEKLRAKHNDERGEQGRRHSHETRALQHKHDKEIAYDAEHHRGRGRGDSARDKERQTLRDQHRREDNDLNVRHDREMIAAKKKRAAELE
jgi:hypothetical protein